MSLKDFMPMQERCSNCSFCKWIPFDKVKSLRFAENCPAVVHGGFNTYSARGRFQLGLAIVNKDVEYTEQTTHIVHECLDCGACDVSCKVCRYNLEPLDHNRELKHDAILAGKTLPKQAEMLEAFKEEKTLLLGAKKADRTKWAEGLKFAENPEVLFFPGCKYSYDEKLQKSARKAAEVLLNAGVKLGYLADAEMCCAGRLYQMGYFEQFDKRAGANIKQIENTGVKTIVTPCSDCYHAFKRLYAAKGLKVEVLHITEYLAKLIREGKLTFTKSLNLTVTYHDPCHLGRQGEPYEAWDGHEKKILNQVHTWEPRRPRYNGSKGIYEEPRDIIKAIPGVTLVEMERIKEYAWCCGAGSGLSVTDPEFSLWTAKERIEEANATGAEAMITACPWCKDNFERASGIKVIDIIDLVMMAM